jgi:two-component system, sensor histidine kinase LadS
MPSLAACWSQVRVSLLLLVSLLLMALPARADHPSSFSSAVVLAAEAHRDLEASVQWWIDPNGQTSIQQITSSPWPARFETVSEETMFRFTPDMSLWVRVNIKRKPDVQNHWSLRIPVPLVDEVSLYTFDEQYKVWRERRAGDRIDMAEWAEKGRYPRFQLDLHEGVQTVYLRVRCSTPISVPVHLGSVGEVSVNEQLGSFGLGGLFGALLLLSIICVVTAFAYRDVLYGLYGGYVLLMMLAVAAYTGLAKQLLWPAASEWSDLSQGMLAMVTAGGAMWFIDAILNLRSTMPRLTIAVRLWGLVALAFALVYSVVPRSIGVMLLAIYVSGSAGLCLYAAQFVWRRGALVGLWILLACIPLALAVLMAVARAQGWIPMSWLVQYGVVVALLFEVPLMLLALHTHSRERHAVQTRERALATQDALTGLLAGHIFEDRVLQAVSRMQRSREDAAIMLISLVNHDRIVQVHGSQIAEQSIVRSVIKLRRVLGDADTPSRVGRSEFAVLIEGAHDRDSVMKISTRLIALGLMPLKGLVPEVTLQFHIAAIVLREHGSESLADGRGLLDRLRELLASMSSRTRRPIRFLDSADTAAMPLGSVPLSDPAALEPTPGVLEVDIETLDSSSASSRGAASSGASSDPLESERDYQAVVHVEAPSAARSTAPTSSSSSSKAKRLQEPTL